MDRRSSVEHTVNMLGLGILKPNLVIPSVSEQENDSLPEQLNANSIQELNAIFRDSEKFLGINSDKDPYSRIIAARNEKRNPTQRTVRCIVSETIAQSLLSRISRGFHGQVKNLTEYFDAHVQVLNMKLQEASLDMQFQLQPLVITPDSMMGEAVKTLPLKSENSTQNQRSDFRCFKLSDGQVTQSATDDIVWFFDVQGDSRYYPRNVSYLNNFTIKGKSVRIDDGLLHEWIHQLAVGDHYHQSG